MQHGVQFITLPVIPAQAGIQPLVGSAFTLTLITGQSVTDISQNVFANLG